MRKQWDHRIQPVLNLLTETSGRIDSIEQELVQTNQRVNTTLDYFMRSQDIDVSNAFIIPGASFKFISKILVLSFSHFRPWCMFLLTLWVLFIILYLLFI